MVGRKPKPRLLRLADGNRGHQALRQTPAQTPFKPPVCPDWLDDYAKEAWSFVVSELKRIEMVDRIDSHTLTCYCHTLSTWRKLNEAVDKEGLLIETKMGRVVHPASREASKLLTILRRYQEDLGMSAYSRTRMLLDAPKPKRKQGDLFKGPKPIKNVT